MLSLKEAAKVFPYEHNPDYADPGKGFVSLDERPYSHGNHGRMSYRQMLAKVLKAEPTTVVLARDRKGQTRELLASADIPKLLKKAGYSEPTKKASSSGRARRTAPKGESAEKRAEREVKERRERRESIEFAKELGRRLDQVVSGKLTAKQEAALWEIAGRVLCATDGPGYYSDEVFDSLDEGWPAPPRHDRVFERDGHNRLRKGVSLSSRDVLGLLLETRLPHADGRPGGLEIAKAAGIDLKAVEKVAAGKLLEQTVKQANAKPAAKPKAAGKTRKRAA